MIRTLNLQRVNAERHKHMDEIEVLKRQLSEMQREVEEEREQRIKLQKCASACMRRTPTAHPRASVPLCQVRQPAQGRPAVGERRARVDPRAVRPRAEPREAQGVAPLR